MERSAMYLFGFPEIQMRLTSASPQTFNSAQVKEQNYSITAKEI